MANTVVVLRGGGDLGSGVAHRLHQAGYGVVILELPQPTLIRQIVSFASAICRGTITIEGVTAIKADTLAAARDAIERGMIAVLADAEGRTLPELAPAAIVDARMAKRNVGTRITDAPVVVALGPGFEAGKDVHAVIETQRGHDLGRVIYAGSAAANTGLPGRIGSEDERRVLRAPSAGVFIPQRDIGDMVVEGETVAIVGSNPVVARIGGVLRGILHEGLTVTPGMKVGDVDPRGVREYCFTISDKARAIGGGVLEALLHFGVKP